MNSKDQNTKHSNTLWSKTAAWLLCKGQKVYQGKLTRYQWSNGDKKQSRKDSRPRFQELRCQPCDSLLSLMRSHPQKRWGYLMTENKGGSKIEKRNSEARKSASVITREDGGGSPTPTVCPKLDKNHCATSDSESTGYPRTRGSWLQTEMGLTWEILGNMYRIFWVICQSCYHIARMRRDLSPG